MAPRFSSLPSRHHSLKVAGSGDLLRKLEDGEIDVAFCFDRDGFEKGALDERFAKRVISVEPLILVVPPGEVAMRGDLAALGNMRFVITETGCVYRHLFDKAFAEAALRRQRLPPKSAASTRSRAWWRLVLALVWFRVWRWSTRSIVARSSKCPGRVRSGRLASS
jgi:DNA-binding transcriptional LysR family regulator